MLDNALASGKLLRQLRDEIHEKDALIVDLKNQALLLRRQVREIAVDFRAMQQDLKGKQRKIDQLEAELRR